MLSKRTIAQRLIVNLLWITVAIVTLGFAGRQITPEGASDAQAITNQPPSALEELRKAFRSSYNDAIAFHDTHVLHSYPVITQDLLNMTLIRSNGKTERFSMD